jgi:hypothetical protein
MIIKKRAKKRAPEKEKEGCANYGALWSVLEMKIEDPSFQT